jgi:hypothetical protein
MRLDAREAELAGIDAIDTRSEPQSWHRHQPSSSNFPSSTAASARGQATRNIQFCRKEKRRPVVSSGDAFVDA